LTTSTGIYFSNISHEVGYRAFNDQSVRGVDGQPMNYVLEAVVAVEYVSLAMLATLNDLSQSDGVA
jgi:hypothetical protein